MPAEAADAAAAAANDEQTAVPGRLQCRRCRHFGETQDDDDD